MEPLCSVPVSSPPTHWFQHKPEPQPSLNFWQPPAVLSGNLDPIMDSPGLSFEQAQAVP